MFMYQTDGLCGCQNASIQRPNCCFENRVPCRPNNCRRQDPCFRPICCRPEPCFGHEPCRRPEPCFGHEPCRRQRCCRPELCRPQCIETEHCCNRCNFDGLDNDCFCKSFPRRTTTIVSGTTNVVTRLAEFYTATPTLVTNGSIVPLTNVQYNNTNGAVTNSNGTISLTPGLYKIDYSVIINAPTAEVATDTDVSITARVNGVQLTPATSTETVTSGQTATVSNSFVVPITSGVTTVTLNLDSTASMNLTGNVVVEKVS